MIKITISCEGPKCSNETSTSAISLTKPEYAKILGWVDELDKKWTINLVDKNDKVEQMHVCPSCQKKFGQFRQGLRKKEGMNPSAN